MSHGGAVGPLAAALLAVVLLPLGAATAAVVRGWLAPAAGAVPRGVPWLEPLRAAALLLRQETATTERPDGLLWAVGAAGYLALAAGALAVVPLGEDVAIADVRTGIVWFGACEALAIVAVFLHGWSSNAHLALVGAQRFVALALSYELLSMFALIAAALPAESLRVGAIVESQAGLWNVVRQPLGLPLWVVVTLGVTFTGPLDVVDGADLAGGSAAETSGVARFVWAFGRAAMLAVFSAMGAAVFLGGWHGPLLPGWLWMVVKTLAVLVLVCLVGGRVGRVPVERAVLRLWTVGLPLSFVGLVGAGIEALR